MRYVNIWESTDAFNIIKQYLEEAELKQQNIVNIGYIEILTDALGFWFKNYLVIQHESDQDPQMVPDFIKSERSNVLEKDLTGFNIALLFGTTVEKLGNKLLKHIGKNKIPHVITSPRISNSEPYNLEKEVTIGNKSLCFYNDEIPSNTNKSFAMLIKPRFYENSKEAA